MKKKSIPYAVAFLLILVILIKISSTIPLHSFNYLMIYSYGHCRF